MLQLFWFTPVPCRQDTPHAVTDVELLTIRLGAIGTFEPNIASGQFP